MKKNLLILIGVMLLLPISAFAMSDEQYVVVEENIKYFKTIENLGNYLNTYGTFNNVSTSVEIDREEYESEDLYGISPLAENVSVNTTYKKMTTKILKNSSGFRYFIELEWKNNPKIRSYDIIAIGHYTSIKPTKLYFEQKYCTSSTNCTTSSSYTAKKSSTGTAAIFKLPIGDFSTLKQTFYFDIEKAVDATILKQVAVGDYSHAVREISLSNASNFSVGVYGIDLSLSLIHI